jgi:hypothetical protein
MPPEDHTPLGDAMTHRFPEQKIPEPKPDARDDAMPEVPAPGKPQAPPADDEPGRRYIPMDLPGREHAPERV